MPIHTKTLIKMADVAKEYGQPFSEVVKDFSLTMSYQATCGILGFTPSSTAMKQHRHLFQAYLGTGENSKPHLAILNQKRAAKVDGLTLSQIAIEHRLTYALVAQRYRKGARTIHELTKPYVRTYKGTRPASKTHTWSTKSTAEYNQWLDKTTKEQQQCN